jgi:hypothetical protein
MHRGLFLSGGLMSEVQTGVLGPPTMPLCDGPLDLRTQGI